MVDQLRPWLVAVGLVVLIGGLVLVGNELPPEPEVETDSDSSMVAWQAPIEVAAGAAYRGPWRMNDSNWDFVDDPTVTLAEDGTIGVAWTDHPEQDLFFQRFTADGTPQFEEPVNISRSSEVFSWLPRVVFPNGNASRVYVLWQEIVFSGGTHGGEAFFVRSTDGGRTFEDPINLSNSVAGDGKGRLTERRWDNGSLDLAIGPEGTIYAAWTEYEGRLWLCRSASGGKQFSSPIHVAGSDSLPARGPSLAVDPEGDAHLVWATGGSASADLRYARSTEGGRSFGAPNRIVESKGHSDAPSLAVGQDGTLHLAYAERRLHSSTGYHLRYTRRSRTADSFQTSTRVISGRSGSVDGRHYPTLSVGPSGMLMLLWERFPSWRERPQGVGLAFSPDGGQTFTAPSVVPHSAEARGFNGSQQGLLVEKAALNGRGDIAVVNSTFDRGEKSSIWLYRGHLVER